MYSSGRRGAPAKGVGRVTGAVVQIHSSPPKQKRQDFSCLFCFRDRCRSFDQPLCSAQMWCTSKAKPKSACKWEACRSSFCLQKASTHLRQKIRQVSTCRIFLSIAKAMVYHHDAGVDIITEGVYHQP